MDNFMGKLKSGANKMAYEAEKVARSSKARNELDTLKNQVKAQYTKLGELYYQKRLTGVTGPEFDALCQAVADLEAQIKAKEEEIQKITAETFESQAGAAPAVQSVTPAASPAPTSAPSPSFSMPTQVNALAQTKVCPACGKEIPAAVKFCPECGKPV
jgi:DNA repair exonuclease SbcCD ATPase subunit